MLVTADGVGRHFDPFRRFLLIGSARLVRDGGWLMVAGLVSGGWYCREWVLGVQFFSFGGYILRSAWGRRSVL